MSNPLMEKMLDLPEFEVTDFKQNDNDMGFYVQTKKLYSFVSFNFYKYDFYFHFITPVKVYVLLVVHHFLFSFSPSHPFSFLLYAVCNSFSVFGKVFPLYIKLSFHVCLYRLLRWVTLLIIS